MAAPSVSGGYTVIAECDSGADDDAIPSVLTSAGYTDEVMATQNNANTDLTSAALSMPVGTADPAGSYTRGLDIVSDLGSSISCSGNDRLIVVHAVSVRGANAFGATDDCAGGGFSVILVSGGGTAYRDWFSGGVDQSDFWPTAMHAVVIDPSDTNFDASGGTFDLSDIEFIAFCSRKTGAGAAAGHIIGTTGYLDPYILTAGDVSTPGTYEYFYDDARAVTLPTMNIIKAPDGSLNVAGIIEIGDGSTTTRFIDSGKTIAFAADASVLSTAASYHVSAGKLRHTLNLTSSCHFAVSGITYTSPTRWTWNETVASGATCTLTSCRLVNAAPTLSGNSTHSRTSFVDCGEVDASSGAPTLTNCIIDGGTDANGITIDDLSNVSGLTVQNCTNGIEVINDGANDKSITLDGTSFDNNSTADVTWPGSGTLTINLTNGADTPSTAATGGGAVTIAPTSVDLDLSGMVEGSIYRITRDSDGSDLLSGTAGAAGTASGSFSYSSNTAVTVRVECWDATYGRYKPYEQSGTITLGGLNVVVSQTEAIVDVDYKTDSVTGWTLTHGTTSTLEETSGAAAVHTLALVNYANSTRYTTGTSALAYTYPFDTITDTFVRLRQGWDFGASDDHERLKQAAVIVEKSGGNDVFAAVAPQLAVDGTPVLEIEQDGAFLSSHSGTGGATLDTLVQVQSGGTLIDSGIIAIVRRDYGYQFARVEVTAGAGFFNPALVSRAIANHTTSTTTLDTYTDVTIGTAGYTLDVEDGSGSKSYTGQIDFNNRAGSLVDEILQARMRNGQTGTINGVEGQYFLSLNASWDANVAQPIAYLDAGGTIIGARGWSFINVPASTNYQLTADDGTVITPPTLAALTIQGLTSGAQVVAGRKATMAADAGNTSGNSTLEVKGTIPPRTPSEGNLFDGTNTIAYTAWSGTTFTLSGTLPDNIAEDADVYLPIIDREEFTLAAGNTTGNGTVVVKETPPNDIPDAGVIRLGADDGDAYPYSSWDSATKTFTLDAVTLAVDYDEDSFAWVNLIDATASGSSESVTVKYQSDVPILWRARLYGRTPAQGEGVLTSGGFTAIAELPTDNQASSPALSRTLTFDPTTFDTDGYGRIKDNASSGGSDITILTQAIYDQIRTFEASRDGIIWPTIATGDGRVDIAGPGAASALYTGVSITISDRWTFYLHDGSYRADFVGANLLGGPGGDPIEEVLTGSRPRVYVNQVQFGVIVETSTSGLTASESAKLDAIDTNVDTANSSLTTIDGKVDTLTTNLATVDSVADSIEAKVNTLTTAVSTVDTVVDGIATTTTATDGKVDTLTANLASTDGKVDTLTTNVSTLDAKVVTVDGVVDGTATKVDELHAIRGLTSGTSTTKTPTGETAGAITLTYTEDGDDITVTRS